MPPKEPFDMPHIGVPALIVILILVMIAWSYFHQDPWGLFRK
jgi:hypothetical protein